MSIKNSLSYSHSTEHDMNDLAISVYGKDVIILDIENDDYYIMEVDESSGNINIDLIDDLLHDFNDYNIISINLKNAASLDSVGFMEERWQPFQTDFEPQGNFLYFIELLISTIKLIYISRNVEEKKWSYIINEKPKTKRKSLKEDDKELFISICLWLIEKTFYINSSKTDCITMSVTLQHFLAKKGIHSVVVVGVRTRPFYSHAWVEVDGEIVNDNKDLRSQLSVILEVEA